jgi:hypothetical protein
MLLRLSAQWKGGIEQYNYFSQSSAMTIEPVLHIQTAANFYGELRYNYEEKDAISLNAGKVFFIPGKFQTTLIPMLGIIAGSMEGYSFGLHLETGWKNFYFSSRSQYCRSFSNGSPDFFFTWSETGYNISPAVFTGIALQYKRQLESSEAEPGLMGGINFKNISVSFYEFSPFHSDSYFVLGLNYEFNLKKGK